ncbi:MAG: thiamine pyrophosphate-dependent dehydrogenase E1 component subunit alpha [Candidatus Omnitrophica bacterium]|nr:thiamine pyrophosphate-dependent dehydrogenase E1 component subunit alpha [Candidatus Omnitrophota bacterium]
MTHPFPLKEIDRIVSFSLYQKMYKIRHAETMIVKHYPENEMKVPMHMSMGQEAIAAGVCQALGNDNQVFASYRSHATYIAKTDETDMFFAEMYGRAGGTGKGKAGSMHLSCPEKGHLGSTGIVASAIPIAMGTAFANQYKDNGLVSCVFFGDGALEEGNFWETLNNSCVMKLPILFVCEDNEYAVHTHKSIRHGFSSITSVLAEFDCGVFQAHTTDVERIYQITGEAMDWIRTEEKPAFIHHSCYRYLEHVGISEDFELGYRSKKIFQEWLDKDPLKLQRTRLVSDLNYSEREIEKLEHQIHNEVLASIQKAKQASFPDVEELGKDVYR